MILNIEADEYTENPLLYGQGIAMDIHDPDISTWLHRKAPKITLAAGSSTSIGLRVVSHNESTLKVNRSNAR